MTTIDGNKQYTEIAKEKFGYDPLKVLAGGCYELVPSGKNAFCDAISAFKFSGPEPFLRMLESDDKHVVTRALQVFSELGRSGIALVERAIDRIDLDYASAKFYILDGSLSHLDHLSDEQVAKLLELSVESDTRIRLKYITLLTLLKPSTVRKAIRFLSAKSDIQSHVNGLKLLKDDCSTEELFKKIVTQNAILSAYGYAALLNLINKGALTKLPLGLGESEELEFLRFKLAQKQKRDSNR